MKMKPKKSSENAIVCIVCISFKWLANIFQIVNIVFLLALHVGIAGRKSHFKPGCPVLERKILFSPRILSIPRERRTPPGFR